MTLTVQPRGSSATKDVQLARQPIQFNPVDSALCSSSGEGQFSLPTAWLGSCCWAHLGGADAQLPATLALTASQVIQGRPSCNFIHHLPPLIPAGGLAPSAPNSKLGYIRVATFSKQTAEKVRAALEELKAQVRIHRHLIRCFTVATWGGDL